MRFLIKRPASALGFSRWLYLGLSLIFLFRISLARPGLALAISIIEYPLPNDTRRLPNDIPSGPDCNPWFTELESSKIGRITPSGVFIEYKVPTVTRPPTPV